MEVIDLYGNATDPVLFRISVADGVVEVTRSWIRAKQEKYPDVDVMAEVSTFTRESNAYEGGQRRKARGIPRRLETLLRAAQRSAAVAVAVFGGIIAVGHSLCDIAWSCGCVFFCACGL